MNIYLKLAQAREQLAAVKIRASGKNSHLGFTYLELDDFLPTVIRICAELGICPVFTFGNDFAQLEVVNVENSEQRIFFSCPVAAAELKGCSPIQALGAQQTYLRRYLYCSAFEISEHDSLDKAAGAYPSPENKTDPGRSSAAQQPKTEEDPEQKKYQEEIRLRLAQLFGDNNQLKKAALIELTTFKDKKGSADFTKYSAAQAKVVAHKLRKEVDAKIGSSDGGQEIPPPSDDDYPGGEIYE